MSMIRTELKESLYVRLTDDEKQERARTAANLQGDLGNLEWKLKCHTEAAKKEIKEVKANIDAAVEAHNSGREHRLVDCEQIFDVATSQTWFVYRGEEYQRRAMQEDEIKACQKDLFGKREVEAKGKPRAADEIVKEFGEPQKLPPDLANGGKKQKKVKMGIAIAPPDDPRADIGYDPKKNGGKSS